MPRKLTVARAADRAEMARRIVELATSLGASAHIEEMPDRALWVEIEAARGLRLTVDLDGDQAQQREGVHVLSWHFRSDVDTCFSYSFGDINRFHFRKATYIAEGFEGLGGLLGQIELGLCKARDGDAFDDAREAAAIAERGCTAAERCAEMRAERERLYPSAPDTPALAAIRETGAQACRDGVKWWDNPHPAGSREASVWDQGHTSVRKAG